MSIFQAIILGVVQGIAEFLPISSSGHLAVAQRLFGLEDVPLLFDVMLHLATLAAVILYFRKKIVRLFVILFRWIFRKGEVGSGTAFTETRSNPVSQDLPPTGSLPTPSLQNCNEELDLLTGTDELGRKTILAVIFATIVTGAIGVFTSKMIPDLPIQATCAGFLVTACLLIFSAKWEKRRGAVIEQATNSTVIEHGRNDLQTADNVVSESAGNFLRIIAVYLGHLFPLPSSECQIALNLHGVDCPRQPCCVLTAGQLSGFTLRLRERRGERNCHRIAGDRVSVLIILGRGDAADGLPRRLRARNLPA